MGELEPGALRELHWYPTNDEWQYYLSGRGQMTVAGAHPTGAGAGTPEPRRCHH